MPVPCYAPMDEALGILAPYGPDLTNGLTSHAPMTVEAMCALGRPEAVLPWLEEYRKGIEPRPRARRSIGADTWRGALGRPERYPDWLAFFQDELAAEPWPICLNRWLARLAPGFCAAATHGIIRVGHAVRSLHDRQTPPRLAELADALAYFAATYQELPAAAGEPGTLAPSEAIDRVEVVPPAERVFNGTITSSLEALAPRPGFASVIDLIDVRGDAAALVGELSRTFTRTYLANARDFLSAIVFLHGVTSVAALRSVLPHLDDATRRDMLRFAWQSGCALYAAFGHRPAPAEPVEPPRECPETLADMAIAHGDEHAIKFTEACLREHASDPWPGYLAAARSALDLLRQS